ASEACWSWRKLCRIVRSGLCRGVPGTGVRGRASMREIEESLQIPVAGVILEADLDVPESPQGIVLFAHGSGSSRHSPRNRYVAGELQRSGLATVLADLLTAA